jgi:hypothetical protein
VTEQVPNYVIPILVMRAMHWSYQDYTTTPRSVLNRVERVLEAEGLSRKAERKK